VDRRTVSKALQKRQRYDSAASYTSLLTPAAVKRIRINPTINNIIADWIERNTTPSTKQSNVIKFLDNNVEKEHILHYRTLSIDDLYQQFKEQHPSLIFSSSYFYSNLPPWLHLKTKKSGLCIYHDKAVRLVRVLMARRSIIHMNCSCQCMFCRLKVVFFL
jgi:hypothetical protein